MGSRSIGVWAGALFTLLTLSACETVPDRYLAAYDACDRQVGACYDTCRLERSSTVREACQQRCSAEVNECFARVAERVRYESAWRAQRDWAFYGRYGAWSPYQGWVYGPHGRRYSYDPYGRYGYGYGRPFPYGSQPYDDPNDCRGRVISSRCLAGSQSGGQAEEPPQDERRVAPDGGVFDGEGNRLRYGGKPDPRARPGTLQSNGDRPLGASGNPTIAPEPAPRPVRPIKPARERYKPTPKAEPAPAAPRPAKPAPRPTRPARPARSSPHENGKRQIP